MIRTLQFTLCIAITTIAALLADASAATDGSSKVDLRIGIIGLDTSHSVAFAKALNAEKQPEELRGCRVVAAYPQGSRDIKSSTSRIPQYTAQVKECGVEIVDSIEALLERVDAVLLETNDGRLHLEQALPVLKAGKPTFIDKPVAASLPDAIAIFAAAKQLGTPVFSSSALRYGKNTQAVRHGSIGEVLGCEAYSPCSLEPTHPDLFWYGIHGVESLFTVMGRGCKTVQRIHTADADVVVGTWADGRLGTFRGMRVGKHNYGGIAFGQKANEHIGQYEGYEPLLLDIIRFFRTGKPSVSADETIEIYAFMQAAEESKKLDGQPVSVESVMEKARQKAAASTR